MNCRIFFLICAVSFGQYAAPNEETVIVVGGLGTQASASDNNGGGATLAAWNAGIPANFIGTDSAPISTSATVEFTTATKNFEATNIGLNVVVGTLLQVTVGGDLANVTLGIYEVTTVTDNDNIICLQVDDGGNDTNVAVNVGGALATLQEAWDNEVNNGALHNRYIYNSDATVTLASTIDNDGFSGTQTTRIYMIGYNFTLTAEATIIITTDQALVNGLVAWGADTDWHVVKNVDFNGSDDDSAGEAEYCVSSGAIDNANNNKFIDCEFHNADNAGAFLGGSTSIQNGWIFDNCEVYDNGLGDVSGGILGRTTGRGPFTIMGCSVHDNSGIGIRPGTVSHISNTQVYDNTGIGISLTGSADQTVLISNTVFNSGAAGISFDGACLNLIIQNNCSVGNTGVGYDFNGSNSTMYFGYNLSAANSAHYSLGADGTFAAFADGNNQASLQTADQIFVTVTDGIEDLTPETGSDLIDNGSDPQATPTIDIGAVQLDAAGGGGGYVGSHSKTGGKQ